MPISKYNQDGTVDIYNSKTGATKSGVNPEELITISPNLAAEYAAGQKPEAELARKTAEKELAGLDSNVIDPKSGADAKLIAAAKSGLRSVAGIRKELEGPAGGLKLFGATSGKIPFFKKADLTPFGRGIEADMFNAGDVILRSRTGAAAPEIEVQRYVEQKMPRLTDSEAVKKQKLDSVQEELEVALEVMGMEVPTFNMDDEDEALIKKYGGSNASQ